MDTHKTIRPSSGALPLSVCLIVRDEEKTLGRALHSVRPLAREIVVVDTGSRDRSRQIARDAGARVIAAPWQDDFSHARNVAVEAATSDHILMLDADEELRPESHEALRRASGRPALAQLVHVQLLYPPGVQIEGEGAQVLTVPRLFRRHPRIRYRGRIHESIAESLLGLGFDDWPDSGVELLHHGYVDRGERRRKQQRNLRLLELAWREEPENLYLGFKLAATLEPGELRRELLEETARLALGLPAAELATYPFLPRLFALLSEELRARGELARAQRVLLQAADRVGRSVWFSAGRALVLAGEFLAADAALLRYLEAPRPAAPPLLQGEDPDAGTGRAFHLLGQNALASQRNAKAREWLHRALAEPGKTAEDLRIPVTCDLVRVWLRTGQVPAAAAALRELSELTAGMPGGSPLRRETMLVSAEFSLGMGDVAGALPLCQAATDRSGADDRGAALLAVLYLRSGPEQAEQARALLPFIRGQRFDTLAARLLLSELCGGREGPPVPTEIPAATQAVLASLRRTLPPEVQTLFEKPGG